MSMMHRSGKFSPLHLGRPAFWFEADDGLTLVGSAVSAAADLSGGGHHLQQTDPTHRVPWVADGIGGRPAFAFSAHRLDFVTPFARAAANTLFAVMKVDAATSAVGMLACTDGAGADWFGVSSNDKITTSGSAATWGAAVYTPAICVFMHRMSPVLQSVAVNCGVAATDTAARASNGNWTYIGAYTSWQYPIYALVSAVVAYPWIMTSSEIAQLCRGYGLKYGITVA